MARKLSLVAGVLCLALFMAPGIAAQRPCTESNIKVFSYQNPKVYMNSYLYLGENSQGVINRLSDGHLAYSEDGGANWRETTGPTFSGLPIVSAQGKNVLAVSSVENAVYATTFTTKDAYGGTLGTWDRFALNFDPLYFVPHPTDPRGLLAFARRLSCQAEPDREDCRNMIYYSINFGKTWHELVDYAGQFMGWAYVPSRTSSLYEVIFEDYALKSGRVTDQPIDAKRLSKVDLSRYFAGDSHAPTLPVITELTTHVLGAAMAKGVLFATKPRTQPPNRYDIQLWTSHDLGHTFKNAKLPTSPSQAERYYAIQDIDDGSVLVNVLFQATNWGNLYASDANADRYAMNLRYNSRSVFGGSADFAHVKGIDGIWLANVEKTPETPGAELQSRITYDKGGEWFPLAVPTAEQHLCNSIGPDCHLHLRSLSTSIGVNFYSRASAIGTVMGTGGVGTSLGNSPSEWNTYISRDAGKVWTKAFSGAYAAGISQNGGIIIATKEGQQTNSIQWSRDGGLTFEECLLPPFGTKRDAALSEDSQHQNVAITQVTREHARPAQLKAAFKDWTRPESTHESIHLASHLIDHRQPYSEQTEHSEVHAFSGRAVHRRGEAKRDENEVAAVTIRGINPVPSADASARFILNARTANEQAIIYLDFNATETRTCQGWATPQLPTSDYEPWMPSDLDGDGCLLGKKIIYPRRKTTARCWVGHSHPPTVLLAVECHCSRQDYMCDYCFAPNITNPSICELDSACQDYDPLAPPAVCSGTWRKSSGYRLVAGDSCRGGLDKLGPIEACPPSHAPRSEPPPPPSHAHPPTQAPTPSSPPPTHAPSPTPIPPPPTPAPVHSEPTTSAPTQGRTASKAVLAAIIGSMTVVLLVGIAATLFFLSSRNARIRHSLMRCVPDTWLPAYMPPDREEGPQYHRLQGTSLSTSNEDIFNDDEFLQEDANVLDIDDD